MHTSQVSFKNLNINIFKTFDKDVKNDFFLLQILSKRETSVKDIN